MGTWLTASAADGGLEIHSPKLCNLFPIRFGVNGMRVSWFQMRAVKKRIQSVVLSPFSCVIAERNPGSRA